MATGISDTHFQGIMRRWQQEKASNKSVQRPGSGFRDFQNQDSQRMTSVSSDSVHFAGNTTQQQVLYSTPQFNLSIASLPVGQQLASGNTATESFWIPISSNLQITNPNGSQQHPRAGQLVQIGANQLWQAQSNDTKSASLLVLNWDNGQPPLSLGAPTEVRPWGSFTVIKDEPDFKLKQLEVKPNSRLSLQRHQKREEHWFVTAGEPDITINNKTFKAKTGDYIHIPQQAWHRLANMTQDRVEIVELQLGSYFGEDDIERQQDDYGRN